MSSSMCRMRLLFTVDCRGGGGASLKSPPTENLSLVWSIIVYFFSFAALACVVAVRVYLPVMAMVVKNTGRLILLNSIGPCTTPAGTKIKQLRVSTSLLPPSQTVISPPRSWGSAGGPAVQQ